MTETREGRTAADLPEQQAPADVAKVEDIEEAMRDVVDPELGINVVDLGLVYGVNIGDDKMVTLDMTLTSVSEWSLDRLVQLANGCTMIKPSPEPLFPTNEFLPPNQLTMIDWNEPLPSAVSIPIEGAVAAGPTGAFMPRLGQPSTAFSAPFGSARHASHILILLFDLPGTGRVVVYEYPAQMSPEEFDSSIESIAANRGVPGSTGYYRILSIRSGHEALLSVGKGDAPSSVEWLENGLDVIVAGRSINGDQALALAARA